jgi:hypothetical protein
MGYVFLGHGALDVDSSVIPQDMEWVAVPQGTTIQFYSDTGQTLMYGSSDLDVWNQLTRQLDPVDPSHVTYNLALSSAKELWAEELKNSPDFAGHTLIRAGVDGVPDPILMCTGHSGKDPDDPTKLEDGACPTDPRQVAAGAKHVCNGILGKYSGEMFWMACTEVVNAGPKEQAAVDTARGAAPKQVVVGQNPDDPQDYDAPPATAPRSPFKKQ